MGRHIFGRRRRAAFQELQDLRFNLRNPLLEKRTNLRGGIGRRGTYWSWDPKETWSLIVWLVYAAFLHARITRGWHGTRTAVLSIVGFMATIMCYLGVNLVLSGLHSYGG